MKHQQTGLFNLEDRAAQLFPEEKFSEDTKPRHGGTVLYKFTLRINEI